ncbi:hypothetical protein K488DRAFT_89555 [Vararia minispora EC-137]|uniref:Uncharacterized protein n=1 Tax=Vararia minispora EC-137 TaxID=1314806 RepID=A0ACB8QAC1_9AGAM|nr:hypothetical protein K488DRAFT_89555 [Vararia minispora EC-137]
MSEVEGMDALSQEDRPFGQGISLWGNMPAVDILCLDRNEGRTGSSDRNIAFVASGDLRNVVRTVNGLSEDYTGRTRILMNDHDGFVTIRNVMLFLILGQIPDKRRAVDIAVHFWYSAFLPADYEAEIFAIVDGLCASWSGGTVHIRLTETTKLSCDISPGCYELLKMCRDSVYTCDHAAHEIEKIRFAPSRVDYLHKEFYPLSPSHRLSFFHFRKSGILLPCAAPTERFTSPNRFLFLPSGDWILSDGSNPLEAWDIPTFTEVGAAHGARSEDLYGCLYFYLTEELVKFATRLTRIKLDIAVHNEDAIQLAASLPPGARFDRVDVSNIMDRSYVGIKPLVHAWGPRLSDSPHAALLGYFMNWRVFDDEAAAPSRNGYKRLLDRLLSENKVPPVREAATVYMEGPTAVYDNAHAFERYLKCEGMDACLATAGLRRRRTHRMTPHRLNAPLAGSPHDLPHFASAEDWYLNAYVGGALWTERFVEIERIH